MQQRSDLMPWWGMLQGEPRSLVALVANGTLAAETGAALGWAVSGGASLFVAAMPRLAGKTTLATSLLPYLPAEARLYAVAGPRDPVTPPEGDGPLTLMINELSDHTPLYVWGLAAHRAFALAGQGARLLGTLHAGGAAHAAAVMVSEHGLPPEQVARVDLVVTLRARRTAAGIERRVTEVGLLSLTGGRLHAKMVAGWDGEHDAARLAPDGVAALAARLGAEEAGATRAIAARSDALARAIDAGQLDWESGVRHAREAARREVRHGAA